MKKKETPTLLFYTKSVLYPLRYHNVTLLINNKWVFPFIHIYYIYKVSITFLDGKIKA